VPEPIVVLTVGALSWDLGLEYAICAVAEARRRGAAMRYDIVGAGPDRERVVYTAMDVGVEDAVRLHLPDRDGVARLVRADVFLWPHLFGRRSAAVAVATRNEIPIVTTVPAIGGEVVAVRDVSSLADALIDAAGKRRSRPADERASSEEIDAMVREARCASS
jgi:glycosyltransferase involved in cell wall biosynthesis